MSYEHISLTGHNINDLKRDILTKLEEGGVEEVVVNYAGYGDSGGIEDVWVYPSDKKDWLDKVTFEGGVKIREYIPGKGPAERVEKRNLTLGDWITEIVYYWLEKSHPGFEINEGADGHYTFKVKENLIENEHEDHYTESVYSREAM